MNDRFLKIQKTDIYSLVICSCCALIMILGPYTYWPYLKSIVDTDYLYFTTVLIAFLNACLLYLTLRFQNKSFEKERFETTFFNLLERHRKTTDGMVVETYELSQLYNDNKLYLYRFKARQCFDYALMDVHWLKKNLSDGRNVGYFDPKEISDNEFAIDYRFDNPTSSLSIDSKRIEAEKELHADCIYKLINTKYGIKKELRSEMSEKHISVDRMAYNLFWSKWAACYEHYIRSLNQILVFVKRNKTEVSERRVYTEFVTSQMSKAELSFILWFSTFNRDFKTILDECGVN